MSRTQPPPGHPEPASAGRWARAVAAPPLGDRARAVREYAARALAHWAAAGERALTAWAASGGRASATLRIAHATPGPAAPAGITHTTHGPTPTPAPAPAPAPAPGIAHATPGPTPAPVPGAATATASATASATATRTRVGRVGRAGSLAAPASSRPRTARRPVADLLRARPDLWLAAVAALYLLAQLILVVPQLSHALGWDESVYISQYDPRHPTVFFSAPRSRGTSFLTAPIVAATGSILTLRVVLALVSTLCLYTAFRVWRPLVGARTTALAALLFGSLWMALLSGSMAMPNLWVAFASVGAVGWFLRAPAGRAAWRTGVPLAACVAVVALFRASDVVWLVATLGVAAFLVRGRKHTLWWLAAGSAAGLAQWIAEAYIRWGGVTQRLHVSSATEGHMGLHLNFGTAWHAVNGPLLCRPCTAGPPQQPLLALWWPALPLLAAAALYVALRARHVRPAAPTVLPVACAASMAAPYLLLIAYSAPRFLLPAYALLSLPLAVLLRRLRTPRPVAVAATVVLALQLASQCTVAQAKAGSTARGDARYVAAARALHSMGLTPPCLVSGVRALPIGYAAGCSSAETHGNNRNTTRAALLRRATQVPTATLTSGHHKPPRWARDWTPYKLPHSGGLTAWKAPAPRP
ncbi:hypothetical protein [Streptomyces beihaiensis]|uniref:Integral membrane protein n=1 Tax=Streptomyces beihaiensis TaxID=2984495 RepID=A0ABT3TW78_9ACTN|nr:hypothetical protein [Streptomyces beihaiensis]MCX3061299.1 hypothetical protein [Streptomyces beihaiensis]